MNNTPSVSTDSTKIFFNLQYSGDTAEEMVKSCIKKLSKCLKRTQIWTVNKKMVKSCWNNCGF